VLSPHVGQPWTPAGVQLRFPRAGQLLKHDDDLSDFPVSETMDELKAWLPRLVADANGHKWINHKGLVSCVICGHCRVRDQSAQKACRGPVRIGLRVGQA